MVIENLEWDSTFFNLKIGSARLIEGTSELIQIPDMFDLVYVFALPNDEVINEQLVQAGGILVDEKVTYVKPIRQRPETSERVFSYKSRNATTDNQVIQIGIQSGQYSRFKQDPNFEKGIFESLYATWVARSIDREIAKEVYVYEMDGEVCGVITLREENGRADIGILAVDKEARGKAVGQKLVKQAEVFCWDNKHEELQVVTQRANLSACRFYEKCGFEIDSVINVYHFWKK